MDRNAMFALLHCFFAKRGYLFSTVRFATGALCNCNLRAGVQAGARHLPRAHDGGCYCDFISFECKFKWRVAVRRLRRDSDCRTTRLRCGAIACVREQAGATRREGSGGACTCEDGYPYPSWGAVSLPQGSPYPEAFWLASKRLRYRYCKEMNRNVPAK